MAGRSGKSGGSLRSLQRRVPRGIRGRNGGDTGRTVRGRGPLPHATCSQGVSPRDPRLHALPFRTQATPACGAQGSRPIRSTSRDS